MEKNKTKAALQLEEIASPKKKKQPSLTSDETEAHTEAKSKPSPTDYPAPPPSHPQNLFCFFHPDHPKNGQ